jgi:hypothetical protein
MGPGLAGDLGWSGPGPFKIVNNYLEAASENVIFGGGDPTITASSRATSRSAATTSRSRSRGRARGYNVKNLFEIKNAQRVLVEGNVFENNWAKGRAVARSCSSP